MGQRNNWSFQSSYPRKIAVKWVRLKMSVCLCIFSQNERAAAGLWEALSSVASKQRQSYHRVVDIKCDCACSGLSQAPGSGFESLGLNRGSERKEWRTAVLQVVGSSGW